MGQSLLDSISSASARNALTSVVLYSSGISAENSATTSGLLFMNWRRTRPVTRGSSVVGTYTPRVIPDRRS